MVDINGQTEVIFDLKTDLDLAEDAARPLVVEAVLEEKDTLIKQNISSRILLLRAPYRLRVSAPNHFKPALPYIVQVIMKQLPSSNFIFNKVQIDSPNCIIFDCSLAFSSFINYMRSFMIRIGFMDYR